LTIPFASTRTFQQLKGQKEVVLSFANGGLTSPAFIRDLSADAFKLVKSVTFTKFFVNLKSPHGFTAEFDGIKAPKTFLANNATADTRNVVITALNSVTPQKGFDRGEIDTKTLSHTQDHPNFSLASIRRGIIHIPQLNQTLIFPGNPVLKVLSEDVRSKLEFNSQFAEGVHVYVGDKKVIDDAVDLAVLLDEDHVAKSDLKNMALKLSLPTLNMWNDKTEMHSSETISWDQLIVTPTNDKTFGAIEKQGKFGKRSAAEQVINNTKASFSGEIEIVYVE